VDRNQITGKLDSISADEGRGEEEEGIRELLFNKGRCWCRVGGIYRLAGVPYGAGTRVLVARDEVQVQRRRAEAEYVLQLQAKKGKSLSGTHSQSLS
jgi:hypothetical protein